MAIALEELTTAFGLQAHGIDSTVEFTGVNSLAMAGPSEIAFFADKKLIGELSTTRAGAVLVAERDENLISSGRLLSSNPALDFARISRLFAPAPSVGIGIHETAVVAASAVIARTARIGARVVIGEKVSIGEASVIYPGAVLYENVRIGAASVIHANVTLREGTVVGDRCILHPGVVLGSDGFGFARRDDGSYEKIEQLGIVFVEDDVEIGSGTTIDRATFGETRIGRGTKIDNLVQIGHNCTVGPDSILCAQVGLAGSTIIGRGVTLAGQVGVAGHLTVGDGAIATAQTGIPASIPAGSIVSGYPAIPNREWLKASAAFHRVPDMIRQLRNLEGRLKALEAERAKE